mmetsp:Transcript_56859/g.163238  ORF Transcript_56859/g.163238 Transcript_56859/m.163238 type:complete len:247 (-) Transcript_56859:851-1591(-)
MATVSPSTLPLSTTFTESPFASSTEQICLACCFVCALATTAEQPRNWLAKFSLKSSSSFQPLLGQLQTVCGGASALFRGSSKVSDQSSSKAEAAFFEEALSTVMVTLYLMVSSSDTVGVGPKSRSRITRMVFARGTSCLMSDSIRVLVRKLSTFAMRNPARRSTPIAPCWHSKALRFSPRSMMRQGAPPPAQACFSTEPSTARHVSISADAAAPRRPSAALSRASGTMALASSASSGAGATSSSPT